jgi:hypothetical protein
MVEERGDSLELFAAIREAMVTVRSEAPPRPQTAQALQREAMREAHMRKGMRQAQKDGFRRIAVVCAAGRSQHTIRKADNNLQGATQGQGDRDLGAMVQPQPEFHERHGAGLSGLV